MVYNGFDINTATTPKPWGTREEQAWKDVTDMLVKGTCAETKDVAGHKHFRVHVSDGSAVLMEDSSGIARFRSGEGIRLDGQYGSLKGIKLMSDSGGVLIISDDDNGELIQVGSLTEEGGIGLGMRENVLFLDKAGNSYLYATSTETQISHSKTGPWHLEAYQGWIELFSVGEVLLKGTEVRHIAPKVILRHDDLVSEGGELVVDASGNMDINVTASGAVMQFGCSSVGSIPIRLDFPGYTGYLMNPAGSDTCLSWDSGGVAIGNNMNLDISYGHLIPARAYYSTPPTPNSGEMVFWRDADDGKVYLVYNDPTSGVKKVELL